MGSTFPDSIEEGLVVRPSISILVAVWLIPSPLLFSFFERHLPFSLDKRFESGGSPQVTTTQFTYITYYDNSLSWSEIGVGVERQQNHQ
jgi:hypothetical protein